MSEILRKFIAVLLGIGTSLSLALMYRFAEARWSFFLIGVGWTLIMILVCVRLRARWKAVFRHIPLLVTTFIACAGLLTLIEWPKWIYFIILLAGFFVILLFGWTAHDDAILGEDKPIRRMKMMLWVFDAYALTCTLFAINIFFPRIPFWLLHILGATVFAYISFMIWRMYFKITVQDVSLWLLTVALLMVEMLWVMQLLPLGYLVSGLLVTWVWYILQLLIRFHFAPSGIVWKKQLWFLGFNALLFSALLILARWTPIAR